MVIGYFNVHSAATRRVHSSTSAWSAIILLMYFSTLCSGVCTALTAIRSTLELVRYTTQKGGLEHTEGASFIVAPCFAEICQHGGVELEDSSSELVFSGRWLLKIEVFHYGIACDQVGNKFYTLSHGTEGLTVVDRHLKAISF